MQHGQSSGCTRRGRAQRHGPQEGARPAPRLHSASRPNSLGCQPFLKMSDQLRRDSGDRFFFLNARTVLPCLSTILTQPLSGASSLLTQDEDLETDSTTGISSFSLKEEELRVAGE